MRNIYLKFIYKILAFYARKVIVTHNPFVIAVTGSVGKTSTKEAIYQVLHDKYGDSVRKNFGNLNAEIGIPLTILGYEKVPNKFIWPLFLLAAWFKTRVKSYPKYLVLEMGVEHPCDIEYFSSIVRPDIAIITSTSSAHLANFQNEEQFQKEKISLIDHLRDGGKAILNFDDENLVKIKGENIYSVAINNNAANYKSESIKLSLMGTEFRIAKTGHKISVKSQLLGNQMIYPQMFSFAVADIMGFSLIETGKSLEKISPIPGRLNLIEGKDNIAIIDDTYNSNPTSAKLAIDFLDQVDYKGRKIAILGNMNELGANEKLLHQKIAEYSKDKFDQVIFVGVNSSIMQEKCDRNSLSFKTRKELINNLDKILKPNDLVLIKASQNKNYLEEVVKKIMKNPSLAKEQLVRQSKEWINRKR
ncbi:MAG: UDP-N-acetylmuramoyl-tripeptide--D-alanyl-D-alanine ligase [Patescibacteria group bacterium]